MLGHNKKKSVCFVLFCLFYSYSTYEDFNTRTLLYVEYFVKIINMCKSSIPNLFYKFYILPTVNDILNLNIFWPIFLFSYLIKKNLDPNEKKIHYV